MASSGGPRPGRLIAVLALLVPWPAGLGAAADSPPGAFALLESVRRAYAVLPGYRDRGTLEVTDRGGARETSRRWTFAIAAGTGGDLVLELQGEAPEDRRVLWRRAGQAFHYDGRREQWKPAAGLRRELEGALVEGASLALLVPLLLAGDATVLEAPEAASVEGEEPCAAARCWRLLLAWPGASLRAELWVNRDTRLLWRTEVETVPAATLVDRALASEGVGPESRPADASTTRALRAQHQVESLAAQPAAGLEFAPPSRAARVDSWTAPPPPTAAFGEEITVALATVVVRAVDGRGRPILGLRPEDFRVVAAGKEVPVFAADWHGTAYPGSSLPGAVGPAVAGEDPPGKLVVVFVQADLHPSRISGQMRLRPHSRELLDALELADRVAVVSFDSHLHLWLDFTRDRDAVHRAIDEAMLLNGGRGGGVARRSRGPSRLAAHFDFDAARAVATPERALQVTAEALRPLPGEKALVYLGWGLGRYTAGFGVTMTPDYQPAIQALLDARATVFVLDVTSADFHDLEVGLESVAEATGGTYSKTHVFPGQATGRLAGTISGYYLLALDPGALPAGARRVRITLRDGRGEILARPVTPPRPGG